MVGNRGVGVESRTALTLPEAPVSALLFPSSVTLRSFLGLPAPQFLACETKITIAVYLITILLGTK